MNDVSRRVAVSAISNVIRAVIGFVTGSLLARWLGPEDYGRMSFLMASFLAFKSLLDMSTSSAFFTFLSQKKRGQKMVAVYWTWLLCQVVLSVLIIGIILPESVLDQIWKGEGRSLILLALLATFMQYSIWPVASQMSEAQRETLKVQKITVAMVFIHFFAVVLLWFFGELALPAIFIATILEWGVGSWLAARLYKFEPVDEREISTSYLDVLKEFKVFCFPMVPYVWVSFFHDFFDRWLLQYYGGSIEQGYFSVAFQFAAVSLIATASVLNILWKEVAEANFLGNMDKVQRLYEKTNRVLFTLGAVISGFAIPWSKDVIILVLGEEYVGGALVMSLMFLYPIHQSLSQVSGTMYMASGLTRPYVVMGILSMVFSSILAYFLMAPSDSMIPGLGLASVGLALKMILSQFIGVSLIMWWLSRHRKWPFYFYYQIFGLFIFLSLGYISHMMITAILPEYVHFLVKLVFSGVLYFPLVLLTIIIFPWLLGQEREELHRHMVYVKNLFFKLMFPR